MRHKLFTALLLLCLTACSLSVRAQRYPLEFKQEKIEKVMAEVTKRTKYEFVYQKSTIKDAPRVTGQSVATELNDILNDIFVKQGQSYVLGTAIGKRALIAFFKKQLAAVIKEIANPYSVI